MYESCTRMADWVIKSSFNIGYGKPYYKLPGSVL